MSIKYLDQNGLLYFWQKLKELFVGKEAGKGLSSNDYTTVEKNKLSGIAENANNYSLPTASSETLGGIKVGNNLTITSGVLSASDTTYEEATSEASGLMPAADKSKLDGIAEQANKYVLPEASTSVLGGVKVDGSTIVVNGGVISVQQGIEFIKVNELPTSDQKTNAIYLLARTGSVNDIYDEYIWCLGSDAVTYGWELIGSTSVDLSGYVQSSDLVAITNSEIDVVVAS